MVDFEPSLMRKIIHQATWISFAPGVITTDDTKSSSVQNDDHQSMNRKRTVFLLIPRTGRSKKKSRRIIIIGKVTKVPTRSLSRKLHPIAYCIFIPKAIATIPTRAPWSPTDVQSVTLRTETRSMHPWHHRRISLHIQHKWWLTHFYAPRESSRHVNLGKAPKIIFIGKARRICNNDKNNFNGDRNFQSTSRLECVQRHRSIVDLVEKPMWTEKQARHVPHYRDVYKIWIIFYKCTATNWM
jgi:hypothetical protein